VVAVGASGGRVRCVVVVRLRWLGAAVSARAPSARTGRGVLAGRGGGGSGVVGSTEWSIRTPCPPRANDPHHDARPFFGPHDDRDADGVPDRLSICLALAVSFGLTGSIEGDGGYCTA
jgi:hypothetical protein